MKVLFFIEDPGAVNFLMDIPNILISKGITCETIACGKGVSMLESMQQKFKEIETDKQLIETLETFKPQLIIVGTSQNTNSFGLKLIELAHENCIESIGVVDTIADANLRFKGQSTNPIKYAPNWIFVPDKETGEKFEHMGIQQNRIVIVGYPNLDCLQMMKIHFEKVGREEIRRQLFPNVNTRKILLFIAEHSNNNDPRLFYSDDYGFKGRGINKSRNGIMLEEILDQCNKTNPKPYVVVRLHPKNEKKEFSSYRNEIDLLSVDGDPLKIAWAADMVVGMTSMLLLESFLLGTPTLMIIPRKFELEWVPTPLISCVDAATNRTELDFLFSRLLKLAQIGKRLKNHNVKAESGAVLPDKIMNVLHGVSQSI